MKEYLNDNAGSFYTEPLMFIIAALCAIYGIKQRNKFKELRLLFIYPLASMIQISTGLPIISSEIPNDIYTVVFNITINTFLLIEFLSIYYCLYQSIESHKIKKIFIGILIVYSLIVLFLWVHYEQIKKYPFNYFRIQMFFILTLATYRIIDFFKNSPKQNLLNEPSFWVTIGSFLYFFCTLPIYLAQEFVFDINGYAIEKGIYSINNICYIIFFLIIIRAYLCKPTVR